MGCNSIRTSHNPPTPELLDACDELGMLVFDETRMRADGERMLEWRAGVAALGRLVLTTPGVPADRIDVLRQAFKAVLADPEVVAEIKQRSLSPGYASGEQVHGMVAKAMSARSKCSIVGTMSSTANLSTRSGKSSASRWATRAPRSWLPTLKR